MADKQADKHLVLIDAEDALNRDAYADRLSVDANSPAKGAVVLTMAGIREDLFKIPRETGLPDSAFADDMNLTCKREMFERARELVRDGKSVIISADIRYDAMRSYLMGFGMAFDYKIHGFVLDKDMTPAKGETEYRTDGIMKRYWRDITAKQSPEKAYQAIRDALKEPPAAPAKKRVIRTSPRP